MDEKQAKRAPGEGHERDFDTAREGSSEIVVEGERQSEASIAFSTRSLGATGLLVLSAYWTIRLPLSATTGWIGAVIPGALGLVASSLVLVRTQRRRGPNDWISQLIGWFASASAILGLIAWALIGVFMWFANERWVAVRSYVLWLVVLLIAGVLILVPARSLVFRSNRTQPPSLRRALALNLCLVLVATVAFLGFANLIERWGLGLTPRVVAFNEMPSGPKLAFSKHGPPGLDSYNHWLLCGPSELIATSPNGNTESVLATGGKNYGPRWSRDGTMLAYAHADGCRTSPDEIRVLRVGRNGIDQVGSIREGSGPTWSPDGRLIAFSRRRPGGMSSIYVARIDGSEEKMLTKEGEYESRAEWSPTSDQVVFETPTSRYPDAVPNAKVTIVTADGTGRRDLTSGETDDRSPTWSPDGRTIAFATHPRMLHGERERQPYQIGLISPDGSDLRVIKTSGVKYSGLQWSPDGRSIGYENQRGNVAVLDLETGRESELTDEGTGGSPQWSTDGEHIAYVVDASPDERFDTELRVMRIRDKKVEKIARLGTSPDWMP